MSVTLIRARFIAADMLRNPPSPSGEGEVMWYADPAGRTEIEELRASGLVVRRGDNDIRPGIAAVAARLRTGRLKVRRDACPNLLAEARLYRYPSAAERALRGENPVDEHNHALGALRALLPFVEHLHRTDLSPLHPL